MPELKELKPCPFCGGGDLYFVKLNTYYDETVAVFCNTCKMTAYPEDNEEEGDDEKCYARIVEAWNKRGESNEN